MSPVHGGSADGALQLCAGLQATVQACAESEGGKEQVAIFRDSARALLSAAEEPGQWRQHRQKMLAAVAGALAEPSCLPAAVQCLRPLVYPAALVLLRRMQVEADKAPEVFECAVYAVSHLIHEPSLREPILECLRIVPPVFQYVLAEIQSRKEATSALNPRRCRLVCEAVLRLLRVEVACLRTLWQWHDFQAFLSHDDSRVRELAAAALAELVGMDVVNQAPSPLSAQLRLAKTSLALPCWGADNDDRQGAEAEEFSCWDEPGIRTRHGVCNMALGSGVTEKTPFVATPQVSESMRTLLVAVGIGRPVVLSGAPGAGKTMFLRRAAELLGQSDPIFLYCDEQTDIKLLLGTYVCGKVVGEFVWRPGVVTEALRQGRWLVLEDVDRVPAEILAALLPLADSRRLSLPDRKQIIEARLGFQLFATLSTSISGGMATLLARSAVAGSDKDDRGRTSGDMEEDTNEGTNVEFPGKVPPPVAAWTRVHIPTPLRAQLVSIIGGMFPELKPLIPQLLESAGELQRSFASPSFGFGGSTAIGPRELLRWCRLLQKANLVLSPTFTEESRTAVLRAALVALLGRVPDACQRRGLLALIAPLWGLACGVAEALLEERPSITAGASELLVGAVSLPRHVTADEAAHVAPFAYTSVHARVLQALAASIHCDEPVLLVGDTGTGKTSVVQHLGQMLGQQVLVYNFSEQSESSELIGGFRPVDVVMHLMSELTSMFSDVFQQTFSRRKNAKLLERARNEFMARRWAALLQVISGIVEKATTSLSDPIAQSTKGCRATFLMTGWEKVRKLCIKASAAVARGSAPTFEFHEGLLVQALRSGAWVVLDEINLAPGDILQRIQGLIERSAGTPLALPESGDEHIVPHANFRIFACMNPPRLPTSFPSEVPGDMAKDGEKSADDKSTAVPGFRAGQSAGKKELPPGIRARFTEIFVDEVHTGEDVGRIVRSYLERHFPSPPVDKIVGFYAKAKALGHQCALLDGAGKVAHFSLRNLTRALRFGLCAVRRPCHPSPGMDALAQGLAVGFATALDRTSAKCIEGLIEEAIGVAPAVRCGGGAPTATGHGKRKAPGSSPAETATVQLDSERGWVSVEGYWIKAGPLKIDAAVAHEDFVITTSVRRHLQNIARMLSGGRFPVLLEGPTSSGKTSLVRFIARLTGHECVRINNHEHTDLQEYLGQYVSDPNTGQLVFQEGVLVRAARAGHWVVLDELNLAPSEVLEALNRLLDDNRELYIADTGETLTPHEDFMVFATQNPAGGLYGGRKMLSRAFRNRFTESFISELPMEELGVVLHKRCEVPPSFVKAMLAVYQDLQAHRCQTAVFQGKQSFMTVRDLLRWGNRKPGSQHELATEGYALLAERLRKEDDRVVVRRSLQKHCPMVKDLNIDYTKDPLVTEIRNRISAKLEAGETPPSGIRDVVWTPAFCRMCALIGRCVRSGEPVLLIGETGGGKTMACQVLSWALVEDNVPARQLRILNCHQQTETSDFIGSLRPVRGREALLEKMHCTAAALLAELAQLSSARAELAGNSVLQQLHRQLELFNKDAGKPMTLSQALHAALSRDSGLLEGVASTEKAAKRRRVEADDAASADAQAADAASEDVLAIPTGALALARSMLSLCASWERIFEWADGALVHAMRAGGAFLVDEISLAEDSVLERLNSVLEPESTLLLAEKPMTGTQLEVVNASSSFRLFATMNPGGDFGKRELSPALRNRFTEVWVEPINFSTPEAETLLASELVWPLLAKPMLRAVIWFNERVLHPLTIREVLGWASFVARTAADGVKDPRLAFEMYIHGGCMTLVDSLGLGNRMIDTNASVSTDEERGCLTPHQYSILKYLTSQVESVEVSDVLGDEGREMLLASFAKGGFAWVQQHPMSDVATSQEGLTIGNFRVASAAAPSSTSRETQSTQFDFSAPSTACNVGRLARALQQPKAVLLEGPPGLGKTATVQALARATNRRLLRINLSEQTDLMDLLGSDLPAANSETVTFKWCDGALLRAMREGDWVLLDEINLAPQATLEGLNALLDHRREIFLPAIGKTIVAHPGFRLFAAQNPVTDGGGRKGLPRSFLNRFTRVVLTALSLTDLRHICRHCYAATVDVAMVDRVVDLVEALRRMSNGSAGADSVDGVDAGPSHRGHKAFEGASDWDWNLRDALRLCEMLQARVPTANNFTASAELLFVSRLRTSTDRKSVRALIQRYAPASDVKELPSSERCFQKTVSALCSSALGPLGTLGDEHGSERGGSSLDHPALELERTSVGPPTLRLRPAGVQIGTAGLPKNLTVSDPRCWAALQHRHHAASLAALPCHSEQLRVMAHAMSVQLRWPVLLVGNAASGKRSAVQWLAAAVGMPLQEISLTPSLDASELLGCFEQVDSQDRYLDFASTAREISDAMLRSALLHPSSDAKRAQQIQQLTQCLKQCASMEASSGNNSGDKRKELSGIAQSLYQALAQCADVLPPEDERGPSVRHGLLKGLHQKLKSIKQQGSAGARFEWVDGPLVTALREGSWVLLSHVEHAAPAVLDRLNSVLEPNGFLLLTESGEERLIYPHPDFRIFFTMTLGGGSQLISRALRNRCIEIFVDSRGISDDLQATPPPLQKEMLVLVQAAARQSHFEFLADVLTGLVGLLQQRTEGSHVQSGWKLRWAHRALAAAVASPTSEACCSPLPSPAFLMDASRVLGSQAPLRKEMLMHMAVLHTVTHAIWCYLRHEVVVRSSTEDEADQQDRESRNLWAQQLMVSSGFTWRSLQKLADFLSTSVTQQVHMTTGAFLQSFLQTYVSEVSGGEFVAELFTAIFMACKSLPSSPAFCWVAQAGQIQSKAFGTAPDNELEVMRQLQPLYASMQWHSNQSLSLDLQLFLERSTPSDVQLRLDLVSSIGGEAQRLSQAAKAYFQSFLIKDTIPNATYSMTQEMGVHMLGCANTCSIRDAWMAVDLVMSNATSGASDLITKAGILRDQLRCARLLAIHAEQFSTPEHKKSAWNLSHRFQAGGVPLSRLPHPILAIARPLVEACASGLLEALNADASRQPKGEVLPGIRLIFGLIGRIRELLEGVVIDGSNSSWPSVEAKVLCLFQQLHTVLFELDAGPLFERAKEYFAQLRVHLSSAGLSWDPDSRRLHNMLLPLTDAMTAWKGLDPPFRSAPDFVLEHLLLAMASEQITQRPLPLSVLSGLLASLRIRRQMGACPNRSEEVLAALAASNSKVQSVADTRSDDLACMTATSDESSNLYAYQSFLILETVHLIRSFAGMVVAAKSQLSDESSSLKDKITEHVNSAGMQLNKLDSVVQNQPGNGLARLALVRAVAEMRVLEWASGGRHPAVSEGEFGVSSAEEVQAATGCAKQICECSVLSLFRFLQDALTAALVDDGSGSKLGLLFMLSPNTLTRLRPPWHTEATMPIVAPLVIKSGFTCAWALNLSTAVLTSTTMANHRSHMSQLEVLLESCSKIGRVESSVGDWAALCRFLASQFYGLQVLQSQGDNSHVLSGACDFLLSVGQQLLGASSASSALRDELKEKLQSLKASVQQTSDKISQSKKTLLTAQWPMPLPGLAENFIMPAIDLLLCRCKATGGEDEDSRIRGALWVVAAMWRIHSGGGSLVPGGTDTCEAAAQLRDELNHRAENVKQELAVRACEELAVDGHWGQFAGVAADLSLEANCWQQEAAVLGEHCRMRPPLAADAVPEELSSLGAVTAVSASRADRAPPAHYHELCQEMSTFATSIANPERITRLSKAVGGEDASEAMVLSELHNLSTSAIGFMQRVQARFPLHEDLVAPACLAIHQLLHGMYLIHQRIWFRDDAAAGSRQHKIAAVPQLPAYSSGGPSEVLGVDVQDTHPEIVCWWLRWTGIVRAQKSVLLTAPRPKAALNLLRTLGRQFHDEEQQQAQEEIAKETLYKQAKSQSEAVADLEEEEEAASFFPGVDEEKVGELLGLSSLEESIRNGGSEVPDGDHGGSLYDLWAGASGNLSAERDAAKSQPTSQLGSQRLNQHQLVDLCALSLEAFEADAAAGHGQALQADATVRVEALDASLELFVRQCVARLTPEGPKVQAILLREDTAAEMLPLVMLRLKRGIRQLIPGKPLENIENIGRKWSAQDGNKQRLHGEAACAFYAESNPGILLQLGAPLRTLLERIRELLVEFEAHPALLALEGILVKILQLRLLQTTPMIMVTMLELLLGRAAVWEEIAARHVSLSEQLRPLEAITVALRERQILEWRVLRQAREHHLEQQGVKWWLHLLGLLADAQSPRTLVDELLRFIRVSPLAQFRLRMRMLRAAAHLHIEAEGEDSLAGRVTTHVYSYCRKWVPIVEKALTRTQEIMEKEVQDLVKIVRWDLSNYHALKESVSRSHKQLSKVIKQFDESLQELTDFQLASGPGTPETSSQSKFNGRQFDASDFKLSEIEIDLQSNMGLASGEKQSTERVSDSDDFWKDPGRVLASLPAMLQRCLKVVSRNILPHMFCFAPPGGQNALEMGVDLCSEIAAANEMLKDEEKPTPMKRRQLQGLREELGNFGITSRPVTGDALDVIDFFSGALMPHIEAEQGIVAGICIEAETMPESQASHAVAQQEPPSKRPRLDPGTLNSKMDSHCMKDGSDFTKYTASIWNRIEDLTSELMHLALRVHSIKEKPDDLTAADVQVWIGLAVACLSATRQHRSRCVEFYKALSKCSAVFGATIQGTSIAVESTCLHSLFASLDQLIEGCTQARVVVATLASPEGKAALLNNLDAALSFFHSIARAIHSSDEYKAHFNCSAEVNSGQVRVRTAFLQMVIQGVHNVLGSLGTSIGDSVCLPAKTRDKLHSLIGDFSSKVALLEKHMSGQSHASTPHMSGMVLRRILLIVQDTCNSLQLDLSLSSHKTAEAESAQAQAAKAESAQAQEGGETAEKALTTKLTHRLRGKQTVQLPALDDAGGAEAGTKSDEDASAVAPQLGMGRNPSLRTLLDSCPLDELSRCISLHVNELPACPTESPLAPFAKQALLLGRAVLLSGLESALATAEISVRLLHLICWLLERGLGKKTEEDGKAEDGDGGTEWAAGTGMGEGEGLRDVTEEIEDDAQLEGTRGEKQEDTPKPDMPDDGKEDTAKEVGFDFDAEAQAVPESKTEGEEPPDKEDEPDHDRQVGDVDLGAGGSLDEKLWNGDDEKDKEDPNDKQENEKEQKEDIEAHGAQGEGEAETVAQDDGEQNSKDDGKDTAKESESHETKEDKQADADAEQQERAEEAMDKGEKEEQDAQFDVNMQPQDNQGDGQGDGEGEGDGEAGSNADDQSDLFDADMNLDGGLGDASGNEMGDEEGQDGKSEEGDPMDLDGVEDNYQPPAEEETGDPGEAGVDTCAEGDAAHPEDEREDQKRSDPVQGQNAKEEDKPAESPPCQGDPNSGANQDTAPQQAAEDSVFGGAKGQATPFEAQSMDLEPDQGEQASKSEQGSMTPAKGAQQAEAEMPSAQPDTGPARNQGDPKAHQQAPESDPNAQERHLQKVDIIKNSEGEDIDASSEKKDGAEKGLHMADERSGADALGECKDQSIAPNQAVGISQEEGENDAEAAAMEDTEESQKQEAKQSQLESMALQQLDEDAKTAGQPKADLSESAAEKALDMDMETATGSGTKSISVAGVPMAPLQLEETQVEGDREEPADMTVQKRRSEKEVRELWAWLEGRTTPLATALCEQLRAILEPTMKGRLQGFYRTGKRISMRRVIPFIASNYRRDKIWLRRTKPSKREYQVVVALDNSRSMNECGVGPMALQTLCIVCQALAQLEVGEYAVLAFGSSRPRVLLPLGAGQPHTAAFGWDQAQPLLAEFVFGEESAESHDRGLADVLRTSSELFDERSGLNPARPFCQFMLIISDGRFNKAQVRSWVHTALSQQQLPLLIIVDGVGNTLDAKHSSGAPKAGSSTARRSVFDLKAVSYEGGQCNVVPYLQDFPFPYYIVVQDLEALPSVLSDVLKQWFELATAV